MYRVKITKLPSKRTGGQGTASNGYTNSVPEQISNFGGADIRGNMGTSDISTRRTLQSVPREEANLEAEKGEVAYGDINGDKFAETYVIGGKRHSAGGTPLNLPEGTYIFSDFKDMKIKDPRILAMFGKISKKGGSAKGGYTPAELAKPYDVNPYRAILQDPDSDKNDIMTAELMIKNYQMKLGALALAAESVKNFEQGIPEVARPYMDKMGIRDEDILPAEQAPQEQTEGMEQMAQYGGQHQMPDGSWMPGAYHDDYMPMAQTGYEVPFNYEMFAPPYGTGQDEFSFQTGGELTKYQTKGQVTNDVEILPEEMSADELANTFAGNKQIANVYIDINSAFSDPTFRKMFVEQTRNALKEKERYKGKSGSQGKTWEDQFGSGSVDKLSEDEIIGSFLSHQKRNLVLQAQGVDPRLYSDANGTLMTPSQIQNLTYPGTTRKYTKEEAETKVKQLKDKGYVSLNKTFSTLGLPLGDSKQRKLEQGTFHGYNRMLEHKGDYTPEEQALLDPWQSELQSGTGDEPGEGSRKRISPIDSVYTNTTAGHLVGRVNKKIEETPNENVTDGESIDMPTNTQNIQPFSAPDDAPWWLQDSINIAGSVMDKSKIKDLYPWAPTPDLEEVQLMKTDPTRELAALSERYGTAANAMASIMPGQSYAANLRGMSGAGDIANTLARYNNQNVQIDNQEQLANTGIRNQENTMRQGVTKQLYDDTMRTMANAQMQDLAFDREKRALLTQGITNKEKTHTLNQMYPQYAVDPSVGGRMHFTQGKDDSKPTQAKAFSDWLQYYKTQGMLDKDAINAAKISSGQSSTGYAGPDMEAIMSQYAQLGGFVSGYNTYPFEY